MPPQRFHPDSLEQSFLSDHVRRFAKHRRAALILGLATWAIYIGWDVFHSMQPENPKGWLREILLLRFMGVVSLCTSVFLSRMRSFSTSEHTATMLLQFAVSIPYVLMLFMVVVLPFPLNYLYYYPGLLVVMIFMFGLFRLRTLPLIQMSAVYVVASFIAFELSANRGHEFALYGLSNCYAWAALFGLVTFSMIGYAIAVELDRTARSTFARERELNVTNVSLKEAQEEMQIKTAALVSIKETLRLRAEQENRNKSKFLADAAHDLRQPLQGLANFLEAAELSLAQGSSLKAAELVKQAQAALQQSLATFRAVLEISRLESGFVKAEYTNFYLDDLIEEVTTCLCGSASEQKVDLRIRRVSREPVVVRSDRFLLNRVIANVISNAIKYGDHTRRRRAGVLVSVVRLPSIARIDIVDNGIGIPCGQWENIFKPFTQLANQERDREKGVGLGLSIVAAIMPILAGHRIEMRSIEGKGTRFTIEVPCTDEPPPFDPFRHNEGLTEFPKIAGRYILYVEDDVLVQKSTTALFEARGLLYEAFSSFTELQSKLPLLERRPDLLITDYRLPDERTADDVLRAVFHEWDMELPTIVLTGEIADIEIGLGLKRPVSILRKPVLSVSLFQAISALIPE